MAEHARPGLALVILLLIFGMGAALWPRLAVLGSRPVAVGLTAHATAVPASAAIRQAAAPRAASAVARVPRPRPAQPGATLSAGAFGTPVAPPAARTRLTPAAPVLKGVPLDARPALILASLPSLARPDLAPPPGRGRGFARAGRSLAGAFTRTGGALARAFQK